MDVMMPRVNGQDATKQIRQVERNAGISAMHLHTPIVGMSCAHPADPMPNSHFTRGTDDAAPTTADAVRDAYGEMDDYLTFPISQVCPHTASPQVSLKESHSPCDHTASTHLRPPSPTFAHLRPPSPTFAHRAPPAGGCARQGAQMGGVDTFGAHASRRPRHAPHLRR